MNPASSRAAVRSMATLTHATRAANPAARSALSVALRSPAFAKRALSSNSRQIGQFPRLQFLNNNKRAFSTTVTMVGEAPSAPALELDTHTRSSSLRVLVPRAMPLARFR